MQIIKNLGQTKYVSLPFDKQNILSINKINNDLQIKLNNGKVVTVEDYFDTPRHLLLNPQQGKSIQLLEIDPTSGNIIGTKTLESAEASELLGSDLSVLSSQTSESVALLNGLNAAETMGEASVLSTGVIGSTVLGLGATLGAFSFIDNDSKTEVLKAEEPKAEEPKVEEPKVEEPKAEEPKAEEPKVEEPKVEEPKAEEPKVEEPKAEEPKVEEPKAEESKAEEPKAEEPKAEEPKVEEPKAEEPKVEEPKAEEPKVEEPKVEEPKAEEPKVEEPKAEEPKVEEPKVEEPKAEESKVEDKIEDKAEESQVKNTTIITAKDTDNDGDLDTTIVTEKDSNDHITKIIKAIDENIGDKYSVETQTKENGKKSLTESITIIETKDDNSTVSVKKVDTTGDGQLDTAIVTEKDSSGQVIKTVEAIDVDLDGKAEKIIETVVNDDGKSISTVKIDSNDDGTVDHIRKYDSDDPQVRESVTDFDENDAIKDLDPLPRSATKTITNKDGSTVTIRKTDTSYYQDDRLDTTVITEKDVKGQVTKITEIFDEELDGEPELIKETVINDDGSKETTTLVTEHINGYHIETLTKDNGNAVTSTVTTTKHTKGEVIGTLTDTFAPVIKELNNTNDPRIIIRKTDSTHNGVLDTAILLEESENGQLIKKIKKVDTDLDGKTELHIESSTNYNGVIERDYIDDNYIAGSVKYREKVLDPEGLRRTATEIISCPIYVGPEVPDTENVVTHNDGSTTTTQRIDSHHLRDGVLDTTIVTEKDSNGNITKVTETFDKEQDGTVESIKETIVNSDGSRSSKTITNEKLGDKYSIETTHIEEKGKSSTESISITKANDDKSTVTVKKVDTTGDHQLDTTIVTEKDANGEIIKTIEAIDIDLDGKAEKITETVINDDGALITIETIDSNDDGTPEVKNTHYPPDASGKQITAVEDFAGVIEDAEPLKKVTNTITNDDGSTTTITKQASKHLYDDRHTDNLDTTIITEKDTNGKVTKITETFDQNLDGEAELTKVTVVNPDNSETVVKLVTEHINGFHIETLTEDNGHSVTSTVTMTEHQENETVGILTDILIPMTVNSKIICEYPREVIYDKATEVVEDSKEPSVEKSQELNVEYRELFSTPPDLILVDDMPEVIEKTTNIYDTTTNYSLIIDPDITSVI
ncbi:BapA/Bap/LapF family prefix-like domain-containing protein [Pasteurella atlantica]|uniref:BapA/Bap/LapF family prefix-like domain-containing protein n=1 Tax=Pasteurellaceae TaxID=712 RepID=UPI0027565901|nr:hypothetical protein [Pasteurella atlantica]MDP8098632.1 hypothetical protein [Pasteurella atlantica]MDP8106676.1 hypothetical protein [Pasteurella atlantica]MDP8116367.1 hypothetical protein [Pasteurella atlantica]